MRSTWPANAYILARTPPKKTLLFASLVSGLLAFPLRFPRLSRKTFPWASCCLCLWLYAASFMVNNLPPTYVCCSPVLLLGSYIFNFLCPPLCQHFCHSILFSSHKTWVAVISGRDSKDNTLKENLLAFGFIYFISILPLQICILN